MRDKAIQALATQMGQLATEMNELKKQSGKLPSDTQVNPKNVKNVPINGVRVVSESGVIDKNDIDSIANMIAGIHDMRMGETGIDLGEPVIPIQIGEFQIHKALFDYGAAVSVLPGSLYDQNNFGPLEECNSTVMLADASVKRPRGLLKNVKIQVGEFYYPVDFLAVDFVSTQTCTQPQVILGRPFLFTANAQID